MFAFNCVASVGITTNSVPSEEVFLFFSGHNAERIGEIIIYVDVRQVMLKHYLISFDSLMRLREI